MNNTDLQQSDDTNVLDTEILPEPPVEQRKGRTRQQTATLSIKVDLDKFIQDMHNQLQHLHNSVAGMDADGVFKKGQVYMVNKSQSG